MKRTAATLAILPRKRKRKQGFASMNPMLALTIQRKGGRTLSQDRKHMAEIGRKGGVGSYEEGDSVKAHKILILVAFVFTFAAVACITQRAWFAEALCWNVATTCLWVNFLLMTRTKRTPL